MHSKQRRIANATQLLTLCRSKYIISVSNIGGSNMAKGLPDSKKYIKEIYKRKAGSPALRRGRKIPHFASDGYPRSRPGDGRRRGQADTDK